jgi:hypothetical protein
MWAKSQFTNEETHDAQSLRFKAEMTWSLLLRNSVIAVIIKS